jgi:hypothetical protein
VKNATATLLAQLIHLPDGVALKVDITLAGSGITKERWQAELGTTNGRFNNISLASAQIVTEAHGGALSGTILGAIMEDKSSYLLTLILPQHRCFGIDVSASHQFSHVRQHIMNTLQIPLLT